jgi:hypothetical protein
MLNFLSVFCILVVLPELRKDDMSDPLFIAGLEGLKVKSFLSFGSLVKPFFS